MNLEVVAKRAKVSTATVSRVLNDVGPVKNSTRTRVLKAVEELKYHPNLHARSLARGQNRTIGMIVSNMENPFFFDIYKAAERDARNHGFEMLIANTDYGADHLVNSIRLMIGRRVAGLAVIVSEMDSDLIAELTDSKIPTVFYDVGTPRQNISNIKVDYARGIEKAVDYLYDLRHRRMGFVSHHSSLGPISVREKAFRKAVARHAQVKWTIAANVDGLEGGRDGKRNSGVRCRPDRHHLRERLHGARRSARASRAKTLRSSGPFRDGLRQYQAVGILLTASNDVAYPARCHWPHGASNTSAGAWETAPGGP